MKNNQKSYGPNPESQRWLEANENPKGDTSKNTYGLASNLSYRLLERLGVILPGVGITALLALVAKYLSVWIGVSLLGFDKSPVSPVLLAILLGSILCNIIGVPIVFRPGLKFCVGPLLRIGIVLLGLRISVDSLLQVGLGALPIVIVCISVAFISTFALGSLLGLSKRLCSLIAVGTSICGLTAVMATAPAINAKENEVAYAASCVAIFGMVGLFAYPFIAHAVFGGYPLAAGKFLGTSIHDTSQVIGSGLLYETQFGSKLAMDTATITKLLRNFFMVLIIPIAVLLTSGRKEKRTNKSKLSISQYLPLFVIFFVLVALARALGDYLATTYNIVDSEFWERLVEGGLQVSNWCLILAMAAIGLGTDLTQIKSLGWRPLLVACITAMTVALSSYGILSVFYV